MDEQLTRYFGSMSNFELTELSLMYIATLQDQLTIFISILFAYLATAYFAAKNLSKIEAIAISMIYVAFQLQVMYVYFSVSESAANLLLYVTGENTSFNTYWIIGVLLLVLVSSLVFLRSKWKG